MARRSSEGATHRGALAALYAQAGGELLMMTGLQQGGPGGALQQSINDDIAAGGQWADLTSDEPIGVDDIDLFGQFLEAQQALGSGGEGGGEGGASGGGLEGCGENDPNCTFYQHVAEEGAIDNLKLNIAVTGAVHRQRVRMVDLPPRFIPL